MPRLWPFILLVIPLSPIAGQEKPANSGQVSLPLEEFLSYWLELDQAKRTPAPEAAPFTPLVTSARVEIQPHADSLRTKTTFEVQALNDRWSAIPLLPATTPVLSISPPDAAFKMEGKSLCFISNKPGKQTVVIESAFNADGLGDGQAAVLELPQAASVTLHIPDEANGQRTVVEGAVALGDGKYAAQSGAAISIRLTPRESGPQKESPARWRASREVFARFQEGQVEMLARVVLRLEENGSWSAVLLLPAAARVLDVKSEDLAGSRVEPFNETQNRLVVRWSTPNVVQREVVVRMTLPAPLDSKWLLEPPLLEGEKDPTAWYGFVAAGDFEVVLEADTALPAGVEPGLWLQKAGDGRASRYALGKPGVTVSLKAPSVLAIPVITCSVLDAQTKLVADGASVSELTYTLRHEPGAAMRIRLPKGAALLSCRAGNSAVQPIQESDGVLRMRLPQQAETKLAISYHQKGEIWDPLRGACQTQLPLASLMVERVAWKIAFPTHYELEAFEGNVSSAAQSDAIVFEKELCNEEAPFADLFYKKQEL